MSQRLRQTLADIVIVAVIACCIVAVWATLARAEPLAPPATPLQCTPVLVTLDSYTRGSIELDGCLTYWHYDNDGMVLEMVSSDNLDGDGIFRNGFEAAS